MSNEVININKKKFLKIMSEWEKYGIVLFKKLSDKMPTSFVTDSYDQQHILGPFAEETTMTELAESLWHSMMPNAGTVDEVHDEIYAQDQINYFVERFSNIEYTSRRIAQSRDEWSEYHLDYRKEMAESPAELLVKLGKPAQLKIVQKGDLETATENYNKAVQIADAKEEEENRRRREWNEKNIIPLKLKKEVRIKDKEQCVVCGRAYNYHSFGYIKTNDEIPGLDNVLLICNGCRGRRETISTAETTYGRFGK